MRSWTTAATKPAEQAGRRAISAPADHPDAVVRDASGVENSLVGSAERLTALWKSIAHVHLGDFRLAEAVTVGPVRAGASGWAVPQPAVGRLSGVWERHVEMLDVRGQPIGSVHSEGKAQSVEGMGVGDRLGGRFLQTIWRLPVGR
jgi:hypothetical protein